MISVNGYRPTVDEYFILMAMLVASRSTCARRRVGCVLVNSNKHVLATGYNGIAAGLPHCIDVPCAGAKLAPGTGLNVCEAIHAEENALIQCREPDFVHTLYTSASPCVYCVRKLLNTPCFRIVYLDEYPHPEAAFVWTNSGRQWTSILPSTVSAM